MKHKISLVVFDIAGTTVKDKGEIAIAFQQALRQGGCSIPVEDINPLMGYKKPEAIRILLEKYEHDRSKITTAFIDELHNSFVALMVAYYKTTTGLEPMPGSENVFEWLRSNDVKIGLDTGFSSDITNVIIERLGWLKDSKIDYVVSSNEVQSGRPAPFMIQRMMHSAGITDATQVVKIGDTEVDVNEGRNAGCLYSIGVTTGAFSREALQPYNPDFIIDDLLELRDIL